LGANNPVEEVESEASEIWCPDTADLASRIRCFISIGTGDPGKHPIQDKAWKFLSETLVQIATQTQATANRFASRSRALLLQKKYFRFNVSQGLQGIGLDEYKKEGALEAATFGYLQEIDQELQLRDCVEALKHQPSV
jgi:hypothetical protein